MFVEGSRKCGAVDLQLRDKVAVIGGASKGLGRACAEVLAQEGVKVALCSRSASDLEKAAKEIRDATGADVLAFPGDLDSHDTARDLIAATVGRFGRLDIMVNTSGGPPLARAHDATEEQWAIAVQRSLLFFARMSREALPHLRRQGGGRIINILASTVYQPIPNLALSGATRMGVVAFAKSLADEVGRDGILVNNVCPGSILSERMLSNVTDEQQMPFSLNFGALENARGGNITKPEDRRLAVGMNDVSNLARDGRPLDRDSRQHLFNLGNLLWHSDSSFRPIPAKYSLLSARVVNPVGGNTEFA